MFRVALCDNDKRELEMLRAQTHRHFTENPGLDGKAFAFDSAASLCETLQREKFDAYFLDIMMPEMDGLTLGRLIRRQSADVPVVYVTSADEYALEAYGLHALRYLKKPVEQAEVASALQAAYLFYSYRRRECITLKTGAVLRTVAVDDIVCVENREHTARYILTDGSEIAVVRRSGTFEQAVRPLPDAPSFIQPHKSFFVNMRCISQLGQDTILMDNGRKIPISQKNMTAVRKRYFDFLLRERSAP